MDRNASTDRAPAQIICVGSACVDVFLPGIGRWPLPGERAITKGQAVYTPGGNALNVAINLRKLGRRTGLVALIGSGGHGNGLLRAIDECGINFVSTVGVLELGSVHKTVRTGFSIVVCQASADNYIENDEYHAEPAFLHQPGANAQLTPAVIDTLVEKGFFDDAAFVHIASLGILEGLEDPGLAATVRRLKRLRPSLEVSVDINLLTRVGSDSASSYWHRVLEPLLPLTDFFMPNYYEACQILCDDYKQLARDATPHVIAARLQAELGARTVIIKLGRGGCGILPSDGIARDIQGWQEVEAMHVASECVADRTGAGDAWCAGFIAHRARRKGKARSVVAAAEFGNRVAAECICHLGATTWPVRRELLG